MREGEVAVYANVFQTRGFAQAPFSTLLRGGEYLLRKELGIGGIFSVPFGRHRFHMTLKYTQPKFGSAGIFVQRNYYEPLLEFGDRLVSENDNIIDGGANQGIYTCAFACKVGPGGTIYAFEPQRYAVDCLKCNIKLNQFHNVVIFEGALADTPGEVYLKLDDGPVSASISRQRCGEAVRAKAYSIDDLVSKGELKSIQLLKLDVEGAEFIALKGARALLERDKPVICIEALTSDTYFHVSHFLETMGYRAYAFGKQGTLDRLHSFAPSPNVFFMPS